jgi:hypothetical protein
VAQGGEEVVVVTEEVEVVVEVEAAVTKMLRVEVEVVEVVVAAAAVERKAKAEVEEENQEAVVENHLVEATNGQNHLMLVLVTYLSNAAVLPFQKKHLWMRVFHPLGVQTHLPFQVQHPHPLRCNGACHLQSQ